MILALLGTFKMTEEEIQAFSIELDLNDTNKNLEDY